MRRRTPHEPLTFCSFRAPWEQVAIDPDGIVHIVDYLGVPLGNLITRRV